MKIYNKKIKKLVTTIVLIVVLLNAILSSRYNKVKAIQTEEIQINKSKEISNVLKYNNEIVTNEYMYYEKDGKQYPIYKLDLEGNDIESAKCTLKSDNENSTILWRALQYGYPYTSLEDIGVSTEDEAYTVTQEAIYCLLNLKDIDKYSSEKAENIVALNKILTNAKGNTNEYSLSNAKFTKTGTFHKENINGTIYYVQEFCLESERAINSYDISINNVPEGTKILDIYNNEISNYDSNIFKIAIPHKNILDNLKCEINITNLQINTFPLLYGNIDDYSYCITSDKSEKIDNIQYEFEKPTNGASITAKVIFQNGIPKQDTKIELKQKGELIQEGLTNSEGIITFSELYPGMYSIYEKDVNDNIVGNMPVTLNLLYNEAVNVNVFNAISDGSNIVIENEKKKGSIEIHVTDADDKNIRLANSELEIYDVNDNLIETLTTNENGIAVSSRLPIDMTYKVKQKNTVQDYIVNLGYYKVEFKENDEVVVVEIENSIKKNFIHITKVDKDNNDIKLEGVVFGIYDANNELIEEIVTDQNGEATSSNLPINKQYYVKEIRTLNNYVLDNQTITVFLTESNEQSDDIQEISIDRLSSNNRLILENQRLYDLLPRFGC